MKAELCFSQMMSWSKCFRRKRNYIVNRHSPTCDSEYDLEGLTILDYVLRWHCPSVQLPWASAKDDILPTYYC